MTERTSRAESLLAEMASIAKAELSGHGIANAGELAGKVVAAIARHLGGTQTYLPKGAALDRLTRDTAIRISHDGTRDSANGILSLAKRHGLSELTIYRILASGRKQ